MTFFEYSYKLFIHSELQDNFLRNIRRKKYGKGRYRAYYEPKHPILTLILVKIGRFTIHTDLGIVIFYSSTVAMFLLKLSV